MQILLNRGNGQLGKLHQENRENRKLLRSAGRAHRKLCEWAIGRLRAELLRKVVHVRMSKALVQCDSEPRVEQSGTQAGGTQTSPSSPCPSTAEEECREPTSPETETHWQKHFPWQFVTPQALNSRGERIFYSVESDQDRMWAWRLERAVDHHRAVRERDLGILSDMHARDLKELKDGGLLRWRQERINDLEARIIDMHKTFHNGRGYGL